MDSFRRHLLDLSRRGLLRGAAGLAALAALRPAAGWAADLPPGPLFTLGVASGDPWPDGVVLWTRLAPQPLLPAGGMPRGAVEVAWEVAEDEGFRHIAARGTALARPELGHAVHVEVGGLRPAATYHYRFRAGAEASPVGRTRTAPAPGELPARLRFANAGCQHYEQGFFTAWRHVAEEELDFVVHYGDYIYEYAGSGRGVRRHQGEETYALDDYRARYAQYRLDADLAAAHAAHPFLPTFDDHEVDNDYAGDRSEEDGGRRFPVAVPPEVFLLRRAAAYQAWYEHMPVRRAALPRGPDIRMHRRLRYGRLADIHLLDTRQHRTPRPCGGQTGPVCAETARPDAQMLGAAQERWLLDNLAERQATWQVLAQQVLMMPRDLGDERRGLIHSPDKWDGYPAARARLLAGIAARGARDVVVLTGDLHNAWAGVLRGEGGAALATEFCATSISSGGDGSEALPQAAAILRRNPHIAFHHNRRGYCLHEATPARMEVTFRALDRVTQPGAPRRDAARLVVEAGRAEIQHG